MSPNIFRRKRNENAAIFKRAKVDRFQSSGKAQLGKKKFFAEAMTTSKTHNLLSPFKLASIF